MTNRSWLQQATKKLAEAGIGTARLDALILLEDWTGRDRAFILAEPDEPVLPKITKQLAPVLARRANHEPLAYLRGRSEFYGREFTVSPAVLVPRPESESIVELLKTIRDLPVKPRIADVGTGSGALGISCALELPQARVDLLDISPVALEVAKTNVIKFATSCTITKSDLLLNAAQNYDVLLCNLPYVPDEHPLNQAARYEPAIAIFGGVDGLSLYRQLFQQIQIVAKKPLYIITESLPVQHLALKLLAQINSYQLLKTDGYGQLFQLRREY